jgi:alpha-tubulin suppressor-like RCC1 family protein
VSYLGSSWVNIQAGTGQTPANGSSYWELMAEGQATLTTNGDLLTVTGGSQARLPIGSTGQVLKATSSTAVGWEASSGDATHKPLGSNIPRYAHTTETTTYGTGGKYPWLADYANNYIPYDGLPNGSLSPVKRDRNEGYVSGGFFMMYLNENHEICHRGYSYNGIGSVVNTHTGNMETTMPLSMEFGGMQSGEYFVRIWYSQYSAWALTNKGDLWCFGENDDGELGLGDTTARYQWVRNPYLGVNATNNSVTCRVTGFTFSYKMGYEGQGTNTCHVILEDGRVMSWGHNGTGQIGDGTTANKSVPTIISALSGVDICQISAGYRTTLYLDTTGQVWGTGANDNGVMQGANRTAPFQMGVTGVVQILNYSGYGYSADYGSNMFALQADGDLYGIGYNNYGALGIGSTSAVSAWTQAGGSLNFAAVICAGEPEYTTMLAFQGTPGDLYDTTNGLPIYMCGWGGDGQIMQGNTTSSNSSLVQPQTDVYGSNRSVVMSSSADGTLSSNEMSFPRNNIVAAWGVREGSYSTSTWFFLDNQGRLWTSGYHEVDYNYQANTSAVSYTNAQPDHNNWMHTLSSGTTYAGKVAETIEDLYCQGHFYSAYWNHFIRTSTNEYWTRGNNIHYLYGGNTTQTKYKWSRWNLN